MKKLFISSFVVIAACSNSQTPQAQNTPAKQVRLKQDHKAQAIFAGGCFWCVEADFEKLPGVLEVVSGYTGGHVKNPSYKQVSHGGTGHYEAAKIIFDPSKISYKDLLDYYWTHIDPTDDGGQFCDRGQSYKTAIFASPDQLDAAQDSKESLIAAKRLDQPIVTPILPATTFYPAEKYHQNYYKKNPLRYKYYRTACGRDKRIKDVWKTSKKSH